MYCVYFDVEFTLYTWTLYIYVYIYIFDQFLKHVTINTVSENLVVCGALLIILNI